MADVAFEPTSIEDREARMTEIDARVAELDAEHAGTVMPEAAAEEWTTLNAERDQHAAAVQELRARRERIQTLSGNQGATQQASAGVPALVPRRGEQIYDLHQIRSSSRSEDEYRQGMQDNARRAIERARFPLYRGQSQAQIQEHVENLLLRVDDKNGTFAKRILATGSPVYQRAFGKWLMYGHLGALSAEEQRAMSVGTDTEGGFAAPFDLDPTVILTSDGELSPLRRIARVVQTVGKTWQGVTSSGITVSRSAEAAEATDDSFTIAQPEVTPTRVIATVPFSVEIDQDWPMLRGEIATLLAEAKEDEEAASFVTGDGVAPNPEGVVSGLAASSEVAMITAGTLAVDDLYATEEALPPRFRARGQWMANKTTYNDVRALSTGSDGGDLWVRLGAAQPSELLGYSAFEASAMDNIGDAAGRVLIFGDFRAGFLIVDRLGMTIELQQHVLGATNRLWTGQRAVNAVWRNNSVVLVDNAFRVLTDPTT